MLKEELLKKEFYLDNMSMFLKDSFGMIDREETYRAVLNNVNDVSDAFISHYDIYNVLYEDDYFKRNAPEGMTADEYRESTQDGILDNIAAIFGIKRVFKVKYTGIAYQGSYYGASGVEQNETLTLTNEELLIYIKVTITKLNYQGTTQEIKDLYYGNENDVKRLKIFYAWDTDSPLTCNVYFCNFDEIAKNNYNSNLVKMFLSGLLIVDSLGITYNKYLTNVMRLAVFDVEPDLANFKYVFDPDFTNQSEEGFQYSVFSGETNYSPLPEPKSYKLIFDVEPDLESYQYVFDPDFEHEDEESFLYAVFA